MANVPGEQAQAPLCPTVPPVEQFTRALDAARQLSLTPRCGLYRARGLAYETLGDFERARADHEAALQTAPTTLTMATRNGRALLDLGSLWAGRDYSPDGDYYRQATGAGAHPGRSSNRLPTASIAWATGT